MNELIRLAEKPFAIFILVTFSGILNLSSYYNVSEGLPGYGNYVSSSFDTLVNLFQLFIYVTTFSFIVLRFKTVVRPALRDPFVWLLTGVIVLSFFWSDFPSISQKYGIKTFQAALIGLYLASRFTIKEQIRILAWATGIMVVFSVLYTLAIPSAGLEKGVHANAWRGPLVHKNLFARLMVICTLPPLIAGLGTQHSRFLKYGLFAICGLAVMAVLLTNSKTALVICFTLLLLVPFYRALRWSDGLAIPFFITLILIGSSVAVLMVGQWDTLLFSLGKDPTLSGRTYIWEAVMEKILERPWLGYGYQAFWLEGGESDDVWRALRYKVYQAHNGFYNIGVEIGFIGLALFVISLAFAYYRAIKFVRFNQSSESLWYICLITFFPLYNYTESTIVEPSSLFWILFLMATFSLPNIRPIKVIHHPPSFTTRSDHEPIISH